MARRTAAVHSSSSICIGDIVTHRVPSMLYHQPGVIVAAAGTRHGHSYWLVEYTNPTTKQIYRTPFASFVLHVSS